MQLPVLLTFRIIPANTIENEQLRTVVDNTYRWMINSMAPLYASNVGMDPPKHLFPQYTEEAFKDQYDKANGFLSDLFRTVDQCLLTSRQDKITYAVLKEALERFIAGYKYRKQSVYNPLNFLEGIPRGLIYTFVNIKLMDMKHLEMYSRILRDNQIPTYISQVQKLMEISIKEGYTLYRSSVSSVPKSIADLLSIPVNQSVFYQPLTTVDASINGSPQYSEIKSEADGLITNVYDSLRTFKTFLEENYIPATRAFPGVLNLPEGKAFYQECIRWHLAGEYTPSYLHTLGKSEVSKIERQMKEIMTRKDSSNSTIPDFLQKINQNPDFFFNNATEMLDGYRDLVDNRINPNLTKLFNLIPKTPLVIQPMNYNGPSGLYGPPPNQGKDQGIFYVNVMNVKEQPKYNMMALSLHEANPGHHMQLAIRFENRKLPKIRSSPISREGYYAIPFSFPQQSANIEIALAYENDKLPALRRRYVDYPLTNVPFSIPTSNVYIEGWGLYAEYLGEELNMYKDDYEKFGRFGYEIWRACRLVVDTGLHYYNWTRQEAIDYLLQYSTEPAGQVEIEVDRYISWPGQALAYKVGEIKIKELRANATAELGEKFTTDSLKDLHRVILQTGPVPLTVLEQVIDWWVADQKGLPPQNETCPSTTTPSGSALRLLPLNVLLLFFVSFSLVLLF